MKTRLFLILAAAISTFCLNQSAEAFVRYALRGLELRAYQDSSSEDRQITLTYPIVLRDGRSWRITNERGDDGFLSAHDLCRIFTGKVRAVKVDLASDFAVGRVNIPVERGLSTVRVLTEGVAPNRTDRAYFERIICQ